MPKIKITPAEGLVEISNYFEELNSQDENIIRLMIITEALKDWVQEANDGLEEAEGYLSEIENLCSGGISGPNSTITITT